MRKGSFRSILITLFVLFLGGATLVVAPVFSHAQTTSTQGTDVAARRAALQAQLNQLDTEIAQTQGTLDTLHGQHTSLQNQINILDAQIKKAQLQLQATKLEIQALQSNIVIHSNTIVTLSGTLTSEQQSLANILRQTNELDQSSLVSVALSSQDLSSFFGDLDSFNAIKQELSSSYTQITNTRSSTLAEKSALEDQQTQAQQLATEQALEEQSIQASEAQKQALLKQTKGQEATYQGIYNTQKQTIAQVQAELFALAGSSGSISLPAAIALAKNAGAATGVEPALILGILKQETDIGKNVGTVTYQGAMSPTRDVPVFMAITSLLGAMLLKLHGKFDKAAKLSKKQGLLFFSQALT